MNEVDVPFRERILQAEKDMATCPQVVIDPVHVFAQGLYSRTVLVEANTLIITKLHKQEHVTILSAGEVLVCSEKGTEHLVGPCVFVTVPGTKRVVYTLSDVFWTTVHATTKTTVEDVERDVIAPSYEELP